VLNYVLEIKDKNFKMHDKSFIVYTVNNYRLFLSFLSCSAVPNRDLGSASSVCPS